MKKYQANALLFLVAIIWGGGFIFVDILLDAGMAPGMLTMTRGVIFSLCAFALYHKHILKMTKKDLKVGVIAGGTNALGFLFQAIGQNLTSASHSALITVTYVIFVPIIGMIFYKNKPKLKTLFAVITCVIGAFLLVNNFESDTSLTVLLGDFLVLLGAIAFGLNIAYLGESGKDTHYGVVSFMLGVMLFVVAGIYTVCSGQYSLPQGNVLGCIGSLLYLGVLSSTFCQILQVLCQRFTSSVSASIILTLEGFFGGVFALFYGDALSWNLVVGGLLIIISVIAQEAEFPKKFIKRE